MSIQKWPFSPVFILGENFNPRKTPCLSAVKIFTLFELNETTSFLGVLHCHIRFEDNFEDDIVTELLEYNLPSIIYEAADLDLGSEDIFSLFY
jgi:hypothetical protein